MVRAALIAGLCVAAAPAQACRLALVLAMDVSASVDPLEDRLQRGGLAAALLAPDVQAAFFASADPVALLVFEWSGRYNQQDLTPWIMIESPADLLHVSEIIASSKRSHNDFPTAMGHALGHAAIRLQEGPDCLFQTIDVAGDGQNNDGFGPEEAYTAFPFDNVVVNGLVINAGEYEAEIHLIPFYRNKVIRGPGSFLEVANGFEDYQNAMERKLIRELSSQIMGELAPPDGRNAASPG
ncbi:DUF1194 domain-containing protein [Cognatiyoonia sp. IB215182]|uniref:DUF1194 domain-containing protein n=1 Tax=Cognatiyoonia sp. IB215182 TaxID=3097353 RepID=UPI002A0ED669|nr:DUF1194 domain-containing protein [Cognatiyoonia sp. IB215182]MDX8354386.1 DUF1194 domain-containing protein [Cognatiyoonia sp. IB215182]